MVTGIQIIGIALAILIFYEARELYQRGKFKRRDFGIWSSVSIILLVFSVFPSVMNYILGILSIGRGLDALLIIGLLGAYAMVFQVYIRIQETNREVTELVRKVAIRLEETKKSSKKK
jgi:hypothetical protein